MFKHFLFLIFLVACAHHNKPSVYRPVLASEGNFVMLGEPSFKPVIENKLDLNSIQFVEKELSASLQIDLTPAGFVQAASRMNTEAGDETNYDAVWVRDSVWVYFSFLESGEEEKAKKLIMSLWDYYASAPQIERFKKIIKEPSLASINGMHVPHIRFNGSSENFDDVMKDGKPEEWNHRQNDAHGLFLLGIGQAMEKGLIKSGDFLRHRLEVLNLFVPYFHAIKYWDFADAGAWEEVSRINTSSVAMVIKALENWPRKSPVSWKSSTQQMLITKGYERIRKNLYLGGESPDHPVVSELYRREDAALFNLFLPIPLKKLTNQEKLLALTILEKLIRPYGVVRYPLDSYQSGNYWIKNVESQEMPELTGDSSSANAFKARFSKFLPNTEAQWFFDSKLAMIYLQFAKVDPSYTSKAALHFKRALGQVTPKNGVVLGADKKRVPNLAFPESINTVVVDGHNFYLPSPITPLNWAKASFKMLIERYKNTVIE